MGTPSSIYPPRRTDDRLWIVGLFVCALLGGRCTRAQTIVSGPPSPSVLFPADVAFDGNGNLFFSDSKAHVVRRLDRAGVLTTVAGNGVQGFAGDGGPGTAAELDSPAGLAVDGSGSLYIADAHNHRVRRVDGASGTISTIAGTGVAGFGGDGGAATSAGLDLPSALAVDSAGNLYIADMNNHRVRRVTASTGLIGTVAGNGEQRFSGDGELAVAAAIDSPGGVAVDPAGNLYVADTHNQRVRGVNAAGHIATVAGTGAPGFSGDGFAAVGARFALPHGISVDAAGNVYVADTNNDRVRRIALDGTLTTVAGDGVQAFRGDGGLAVAASLDSPRGVAVSPGGLPTLADSGNQRVRQVEANGTIMTLAGAGAVVPVEVDALTLSAPPAVYGSGTVTATLTGGGAANGPVAFFEGAAALGSAALSGGVATLDTGGLNAGAHAIQANYPGDATHAPATSAVVNLVMTPAPVSAGVDSVGLVYGQPVPALVGTLTGVLQRDGGAVSLQLTTAAAALSPVGSYPVAGKLAGTEAVNYELQPVNASVVIAKAGSAATLADSAASVASNVPVTLSVHVASSTTGVPTGQIALMDGATIVATVPLSGTGDATYTTSSLTAGAHSLVGVYAGDKNFLGSTTAVQTVAVASPPAPDFTIAAVGAASQTVPAGASASFSFAVAMEGGPLASPIALAASGLPVGTTASFNPGTVVPGGANAFQLTVQTVKTTAAARKLGKMAWAVLLLPWLPFGRRRMAAWLVCLGGLVALAGCGATIIAVPQAAKSYPITVSGTATSASGVVLQRTATVTLLVQ